MRRSVFSWFLLIQMEYSLVIHVNHLAKIVPFARNEKRIFDKFARLSIK